MSHLPTSALFLQHPLPRNSTGCCLFHKSHLLFLFQTWILLVSLVAPSFLQLRKSATLFLPTLIIILQIFTIFFQLSLLQAELQLIPLTLVQQLFHTFDYSPCLSLRVFQVFCIFWDERQERTTENWRCGIAIDLYSILMMLWFVFYFLPNTS